MMKLSDWKTYYKISQLTLKVYVCVRGGRTGTQFSMGRLKSLASCRRCRRHATTLTFLAQPYMTRHTSGSTACSRPYPWMASFYSSYAVKVIHSPPKGEASTRKRATIDHNAIPDTASTPIHPRQPLPTPNQTCLTHKHTSDTPHTQATPIITDLRNTQHTPNILHNPLSRPLRPPNTPTPHPRPPLPSIPRPPHTALPPIPLRLIFILKRKSRSDSIRQCRRGQQRHRKAQHTRFCHRTIPSSVQRRGKVRRSGIGTNPDQKQHRTAATTSPSSHTPTRP